MRRLVLLPRAEIDVTEAALWYEAEREGLGRSFQTDVDRLLTSMQEVPQRFPEIEPGVRRGMLDRFPYAAYAVLEDDVLVVLAVLHLHRHPQAWRRPG